MPELADPPTRLSPHGNRVVADSRTAPAVGDRDRRHAAQRIAAIGGAGGHDFRAGWRDDGRDALSVPNPPPAGRRGSREPEPVDNALGRAAAGLAVGLAATPRAASTPGSTSRPTTPSASSERSPATAGGTGTDVRVTGLAARPGPPRAAPRRPVLRPWPPCHGSRTVRPQSPSRLCASDSTPGVPCREVPDRRLEACAGRPRRVPSRRGLQGGAAGTVSKDPRTDQVDDLGRRSRERPQQDEIG